MEEVNYPAPHLVLNTESQQEAVIIILNFQFSILNLKWMPLY